MRGYKRINSVYLVFDGGNGGHLSNKGYGSFKVFDKKHGSLLHHEERYPFDGEMTNNEAEYRTLILALKWISDNIDDPEFVYGALQIEGDSELVRQQVLGNWQIKKPHLKPLCKEAQYLLNLYTKWTYTHVPRAEIVALLGH